MNISNSYTRDGPWFLACLIAIFILLSVVEFNYTPSMPYGFYLRVPIGKIKVGDLIVFDNPMDKDLWGVGISSGIMKRVVAVEDGLYRVAGENPASYDSRYYGLIGREYITQKIIPLWVFREIPEWMETKISL